MKTGSRREEKSINRLLGQALVDRSFGTKLVSKLALVLRSNGASKQLLLELPQQGSLSLEELARFLLIELDGHEDKLESLESRMWVERGQPAKGRSTGAIDG